MTNYYKILGVQNFATNSEIKIAYRKLSKKFHPDVNHGDKFFEERFKEIQTAYEYLCDSIKKQNLDDFLKHKEVKFKNENTQTKEYQENEHPQSHSANNTSNTNTPEDNTFNKRKSTHSIKRNKYSFVFILIGVILFISIYKFKSKNNSQDTYYTSTSATDTFLETDYNNFQASYSNQEYDINSYQEAIPPTSNSVKSFSIGSSKNEVLNIQGNPTRTVQFESFDEEIWYFGSSSVTFKNGMVKEYSNYNNNLKVRYAENTNINNNYNKYELSKNFTIGSSKNEVLSTQGNPTRTVQFESFDEEIWYFGSSSVTFKNGMVKEYSNYNNNLKVKYAENTNINKGYNEYNLSKYFSIGSSKNEVLNIQGNPTRTVQFESFGEEIWYFGSSSVTFKNGMVKEYSNYNNNLKVKY